MHDFFLTTLSAPLASRRLAKAAICLLRDLLLDEELLHDLDLVLTEACSNVARHAYPDGPGRLEIRVGVEPGAAVELDVIDWGRGVPKDRVIDTPPDPLAEGGRGLFIMSRLCDEFTIRRRGKRNVVHLRKNIGAEQWKTSA